MSTFSPPRHEKARADDSHLPKGDCRYILLHPEVKGLRCACVGFALNRSIPGSTCECGHQACYHTPEVGVDSADRQELESLKEKINMLQDELDRERYGGRGGLVDRLGRLEELVDKSKAEADTEVKNAFRQIGGLWQNVGLLNKRTPYYDDQIEALIDSAQRIETRLIEVDDASIHVEERVEALEVSSTPFPSRWSRRRKASTPPPLQLEVMADSEVPKSRPVSQLDGEAEHLSPLHSAMVDDPSRIQSFRERVASVGSGSQSWTVHTSLLPTSSQPFPFEKDTAAYKRCLSRGLHRVIVIPDSDNYSFQTAVSEAFSEILRGRPWHPLVARICDAMNLRGLPMLRQLPESLIGCDYDVEFLTKNCAVVDDSGKILDLYIAMAKDTLSWVELRGLTPFLPGLEASWTYDPYLDGDNDPLAYDGQGQDAGALEKLPAAGDILPNFSPTSTRLKRTSSEISRTSSFGSTAEGEDTRAKVRRQCTGASVEVLRRAEAV